LKKKIFPFLLIKALARPAPILHAREFRQLAARRCAENQENAS
jgi:hypothetical protein